MRYRIRRFPHGSIFRAGTFETLLTTGVDRLNISILKIILRFSQSGIFSAEARIIDFVKSIFKKDSARIHPENGQPVRTGQTAAGGRVSNVAVRSIYCAPKTTIEKPPDLDILPTVQMPHTHGRAQY